VSMFDNSTVPRLAENVDHHGEPGQLPELSRPPGLTHRRLVVGLLFLDQTGRRAGTMCKEHFMGTEAWNSFQPGNWQETIDVRDFIQRNYAAYEGDGSFLAPATERTRRLFAAYDSMHQLEQQWGGVLGVDASTVSSLLTYAPGYLDKENEIIVGLQTARPLQRSVNPFGGIRMARAACEAYGYKLDDRVEEYFRYRTTHNDGVFRVYSDEMRAVRRSGVVTGLPMPMVGAGSSATTDAWRSMVWTGSSRPSRPTRPLSAKGSWTRRTSGFAKSCSARLTSSGSSRKWRPCMGTTSPAPRAMRGRPCSGSTLRTLGPSRNRMALPCPWAGSAPSLMSTSSAIWTGAP
jgi:hypothetical protein